MCGYSEISVVAESCLVKRLFFNKVVQFEYSLHSVKINSIKNTLDSKILYVKMLI